MSIYNNNPYAIPIHVVDLAKNPDVDIRRLSQTDRKLLALTCDIFKDIDNREIENKLRELAPELEKLKKKLLDIKSKISVEKEINKKPKETFFLIKFFKFLGNQLNIRISSDDLYKKIENAKGLIDNKILLERLQNEINKAKYQKDLLIDLNIINDFAKTLNLSEKKLNVIQKTIHDFKEIAFLRQDIKVKIALNHDWTLLTNVNMKDIPETKLTWILDNAPELLTITFKRAQAKGLIDNFFADAFAEEDSSFITCYRRVLYFANDMEEGKFKK